MKNFVRIQKITEVVNRLDYIKREGKYSEKKLAEQLVLSKDFFGEENWQKLADFEKAESERLNQKLNEARELIIALPNQMFTSPDAESQYDLLAKDLAKEQPYAYAIHWNSSKTNLHMHLLLAERQMTQELEPKTYRQDIWAKADGSMAMKKEDRVYLKHKKGDIQRDENGNIKYKESKNSGFSLKNPELKSKVWLQNLSKNVQETLQSLGYEITTYDPKGPYLAEKHQGKGNNAYTKRVKKENEYVKKFNKEIEPLVNSGYLKQEKLLDFKLETAQEFKQGIFNRVFTRIKAWLENLKQFTSNAKEKVTENIAKAKQQIGEIIDEIRPRISGNARPELQHNLSYQGFPGLSVQSTTGELRETNGQDDFDLYQSNSKLLDEFRQSVQLNYISIKRNRKKAELKHQPSYGKLSEELQPKIDRPGTKRIEATSKPHNPNFEERTENGNQRKRISELESRIKSLEYEVKSTGSVRSKIEFHKLTDELNALKSQENDRYRATENDLSKQSRTVNRKDDRDFELEL